MSKYRKTSRRNIRHKPKTPRLHIRGVHLGRLPWWADPIVRRILEEGR